ncbi:hypothetical protein [Brevundimonas lenta]|uniref:Uncharacterized protein n=1 Tax=Brevundimonas lenta TaxID=424796 RepID=A0A7W6JHF7_9CAUL|nr:hypothetical protein [Brevundimonas lenta]MBB4084196.1 hypothetical protein [Brevundimonas lenta]
MRMTLLIAGLLAVAGAAQAQTPAETFARARMVCEADGGALWGVDLCGPILLVDPATRTLYATRAGASDALKPDGDVFTGVLPTEINIANTALDWDGVRWAMLMTPLPGDAEDRDALIAHESWHGVQARLGLSAASPAPAHLATEEGRVLMRLEWRALAAALAADAPEDRQRAVADALAFRSKRRGADDEERQLELNEGLAEYTGVRLGRRDPRASVIAALTRADGGTSFARSFAYASGPAYGLLLDDARPAWRGELNVDSDLGRMLGEALQVEPTGDIAAAEARYDAATIRTEESATAAARRAIESAWRSKLVDGPRLVLPLVSMQMAFNPGGVTPLPGAGTVYPTLRVVDAWGVLEVSDGALIDPNYGAVAVAAPSGAEARDGPGWTLTLNPGWRLEAGERAGDFRLVRP